MILDFIGDHCGWLALSEDKQKQHPNQPPGMRRSLEYNKDGYNNNDEFIEDVKRAIAIHNIKYPHYQAIFHFDNSKVHTKKSPNLLNANLMSAKEGGKQRSISNTCWTNSNGAIHEQEI